MKEPCLPTLSSSTTVATKGIEWQVGFRVIRVGNAMEFVKKSILYADFVDIVVFLLSNSD